MIEVEEHKEQDEVKVEEPPAEPVVDPLRLHTEVEENIVV